MKRHAKGLDEITYNLQESQDFFDASVDGRLTQFHQIEKCMIMAQLAALKRWPEESARRQFVEEELAKDMEFVESNMHEDDDKKRHKHRMRSMHRDFWAVLRWQRRRLKKVLGEADIEADDGTLKPKPADVRHHSRLPRAPLTDSLSAAQHRRRVPRWRRGVWRRQVPRGRPLNGVTVTAVVVSVLVFVTISCHLSTEPSIILHETLSTLEFLLNNQTR